VEFQPVVEVGPRTLDGLALASAPGRTAILGNVVDAGGCTPSWNGRADVTDERVTEAVRDARARGGELTVSFGVPFGSSAPDELALGCPTSAAAVAAHLDVIDHLGVESVDFLVDTARETDSTVDRRNDVIAAVQRQADAGTTALRSSFTLTVGADGLDDTAIDLLRSARAAGVSLNRLNLLVGGQTEPDGWRGDTADLVITAAARSQERLAEVWPEMDATQRWALLGIMPVIGDVNGRGWRFTVEDARTLRGFARTRGIGALSMWAAGRDAPCTGDAPGGAAGCSGLDEEPGAFGVALGDLGAAKGRPEPTSTTSPRSSTTSTVATPAVTVAPFPVPGTTIPRPAGPPGRGGVGRPTPVGPVGAGGGATGQGVPPAPGGAGDPSGWGPIAPGGPSTPTAPPEGRPANPGTNPGTTPPTSTPPNPPPRGSVPSKTVPTPAPSSTVPPTNPHGTVPSSAPTTSVPPTQPPGTAPPTTRPGPTTPATFATTRLTTSSWETGHCSVITVRNVGGTAGAWSVWFDPAGRVVSAWSARISGNVATGDDWNAVLSPGAATSFGWCADY
jgi:chitinase